MPVRSPAGHTGPDRVPVFGVVLVDLCRVPEDRWRQELLAATGAPVGATVEVHVPNGAFVPLELDNLAAARQLGRVVIKSDTATVKTWTRALYEGVSACLNL